MPNVGMAKKKGSTYMCHPLFAIKAGRLKTPIPQHPHNLSILLPFLLEDQLSLLCKNETY